MRPWITHLGNNAVVGRVVEDIAAGLVGLLVAHRIKAWVNHAARHLEKTGRWGGVLWNRNLRGRSSGWLLPYLKCGGLKGGREGMGAVRGNKRRRSQNQGQGQARAQRRHVETGVGRRRDCASVATKQVVSKLVVAALATNAVDVSWGAFEKKGGR